MLLKDKMRSLIQQGRKKLLLNLGDVSYVDSAGLGEIVQPNKQCLCFFRGECVNPDYFCLDHLPAEKLFAAVERVWAGQFNQEQLQTPGMTLSTSQGSKD